jgi:pimeloyl-ACP methyl ester carboxylesterase
VGLDHNIWDPQINEFDNTVLIYDILGHGRTPLNKEKISFDDFSDQIIDLIDELKFSKIHLIGFSIGSLIARNFATRFSNRLKSLTLLCSIFNRSDNEQKIVNERFEQTKKDKKLTKDALKRWFNKDFIEKNPQISDKIFSILSNNNMDNFIKVYSLFVNHEDNEKFENINVKTLVMTGEGDVGSTPEMSDNLSKKIKNSEVKIIPVGKHLCSIECSYDVNNAIKDHIQNA